MSPGAGAGPALGPAVGRPVDAGPRPVRMVVVTAVWGLCFVLIWWGLRDAPPLWFASLRSTVAGFALLVWGAVRRRPNPRARGDWRLVVLLAATNAGLAFGAMFAGVAGLSTGVAAVLANAQPLLVLLPAWWLYGERVSPRTVVALAAGFAGLATVAGPGGGGRGALLSLLAAAGITAGTLLARRTGHLDVVMVSGWHFLLGGAALAITAAVVEGQPAVSWTPRFAAVLAALAVVGTAWSFAVWFEEAQRCRLSLLTAWTFLTPVFGMAFGVLLLGERPTGWTLAGLALVLASLWWVLRPGLGRVASDEKPALTDTLRV